jgi:hypothetical protein
MIRNALQYEQMIAIVAEDKLTEAVLKKCVSNVLPRHLIHRSEVKGGRGNVQNSIKQLVELAKIMPVLVGVDLDNEACAPTLISSWGDKYGSHDQLMIRVAVREIEAWILADSRRVSELLGAPVNDISTNPEQLLDPKAHLLQLARRHSSDSLKRKLVPRNFNSDYPRVGPEYNLRICEFVVNRWRPDVAENRSPSLKRLMSRLRRV